MPAPASTVLHARFMSKPPFSVDVPGCKPVEGEGIPRRNTRSVDKLVSTLPGVETMFDIVTYAAKSYGDSPAIGSRKLIAMHEETKKVTKVVDGKKQEVDKTWSYFEMSKYTYLSARQYETLVLQIGAGLRNLGLVETDRVHIFAQTRYDFIVINSDISNCG